MWKIDNLEDGESVEAVAPIYASGVPEFTCRLVLTDRRILTIRSPYLASIFVLARYLDPALIVRSLSTRSPLFCSRVALHPRFRLRPKTECAPIGATGIGIMAALLSYQMSDAGRLGTRSDESRLELPPFAGYTCDPPPGIGIQGNLLGCKPDQEVCGEVESVIRVSRPFRR